MNIHVNSHEVVIDKDLHSRQLAVYGRDAMRHLFGANVLISGLQRRGVEIAKNVILAGVKLVTLHDQANVEACDLPGNFYFTEDDIGENRALACCNKLQDLNKVVIVTTLTTSLSKQYVSTFQVVVFTDTSYSKAIEFDEFCHSQEPPIAFIKAEILGIFGNVFYDFGPNFTVFNVDGEEPHPAIIASISNDNPALVTCVDEEWLVVFSEVLGMIELNDGKSRKVRNVKLYSFDWGRTYPILEHMTGVV